MNTLLRLAPICTLLFLWSVLACVLTTSASFFFAALNRYPPWTDQALDRAFGLMLIATIISGAGMIALGTTSVLMIWWSGPLQ